MSEYKIERNLAEQENSYGKKLNYQSVTVEEEKKRKEKEKRDENQRGRKREESKRRNLPVKITEAWKNQSRVAFVI